MLQKILNNFKEISKVPRCSFNQEKILEFFKNWAKSLNFEYKVDNAKNIVIYVPATKWRENDETIILQNHMDMVCVKDNDSNHCFEKDSIEIIEKDWWISANKTTLWADNWMWLAIAMYLSEIKNHPKLEILVTSWEEVGLIWALALDASMLSGKKLINIDTEDLWEICVSSAWWLRIDIEKELNFSELKNKNIFKLFIWWMKWWHSGIEINKNRWNAIFSFLEFLNDYKDNFEIIEIKWWVADNAIPKELEVIISLENEENFKQQLDLFLEKIKNNFDAPEVFYNLKPHLTSPQRRGIEWKIFKKLIKPVLETKIWVLEMSKNIENLVKTSINLWEFSIKDWKIKICYMPRSSDKNDLEKIKNNISENFTDFKIIFWDEYPWWEENPNSDFVKEISEIYKKNNNWKAEILAYHAGLECGALVEKLWWNIQAISIWPTIKNAHTTKEMCELKSVEIIAKILIEYLWR